VLHGADRDSAAQRRGIEEQRHALQDDKGRQQAAHNNLQGAPARQGSQAETPACRAWLSCVLWRLRRGDPAQRWQRASKLCMRARQCAGTCQVRLRWEQASSAMLTECCLELPAAAAKPKVRA